MRLRYTLAALLLVAAPAAAQTPGSCALGMASAELSRSDVRTSLFNTGNLFFDGGAPAYRVPKIEPTTAIFSGALWITGAVGADLRGVTATYADWELWPGPLDDGATLPDPSDCSAYDRIWRVGAPEVAAYEQTGLPARDLADWPVGLGAPAVDASGAPVSVTSREQTVNLAAGERPVIYGTETAFWVMNDVGNMHTESETAPLGIEVRMSAFSVNDPDERHWTRGRSTASRSSTGTPPPSRTSGSAGSWTPSSGDAATTTSAATPAAG